MLAVGWRLGRISDDHRLGRWESSLATVFGTTEGVEDLGPCAGPAGGRTRCKEMASD